MIAAAHALHPKIVFRALLATIAVFAVLVLERSPAAAEECDRLQAYPGVGQPRIGNQIAANQCRGSVPYAAMANDVYKDQLDRSGSVPGGYRSAGDWRDLLRQGFGGLLDIDHSVEAAVSGFAAGIYENPATGEVVVSFRGSEMAINDWIENFHNGSLGNLPGNDTTQYALAAEVARRVLEKYKGRKITFTGHSLGGGLANQALLAAHQAIERNPDYAGADVRSVVFNAAPMNNRNARALSGYDADIQNIWTDGDPLHDIAMTGPMRALHTQVGQPIVIPVTDKCTQAPGKPITLPAVLTPGTIIGAIASNAISNKVAEEGARHSMDGVERELSNCIRDAERGIGNGETKAEQTDKNDPGSQEPQQARDDGGNKDGSGDTADASGADGSGDAPDGGDGSKPQLPEIKYVPFWKQ